MSAFHGFERDLKRYDPLLFLQWDYFRGRWVVMRDYRKWFHGNINGDFWLSWYRHEPVEIMTLRGPDGQYRDPGNWVLARLHKRDSHRFKRTVANEKSNHDLHKEIEDMEKEAEEKSWAKFRDDLGCITRENWNQAAGNAVVAQPEKVI